MSDREELEALRRLAELEARATQGGEAPSQEWMNRTMAGMTLADKPWYERAAIQAGAGVDTLVRGAKQLFASDKPEGLNDLVSGDTPLKRLQREEARMRPLKKALAAASDTGTMPDWMPTGGAALQVAGEVLPTMAVPAGAYARGMSMLPRAMRLMKAAPAPARLGTAAAVGDAAVGGAVMGALQPTVEGESRAENSAKGAAFSAATPLALAGGRQGYRMVAPGGGRARAADQIADELGGETMLRQTLERLRAGGQQGPIPLSTAAQLGDPQLARLEAGSRARSGANWYDFDQAQAKAVADEVMRATSAADELAARRALRSSNYQTARNQAMASVNEGAFVNDLGRFRSNLDQAMLSAEASNPAVRNMLKAISDDIDRVTSSGMQYTPDHLATIRANLSGRQNPMDPNVFKAAPRDSVATLSVLREVDSILNNATNGRWQNAVRTYAQGSDAVRSAQAAGKVRGSFIDRETGRVMGVSADAAGDVPKITEAGLGRAMNAARGADKSLVLAPEANQRLENVLGALRKQNIVQGVKRSATAGGGSNTASDQFAARAAGQVGDVVAGAAGGVAGMAAKGAIDKALDFANMHRDRALAEALQDPAKLMQMLERRLAAGQPLSVAENGVLQILRGAPAAAAN